MWNEDPASEVIQAMFRALWAFHWWLRWKFSRTMEFLVYSSPELVDFISSRSIWKLVLDQSLVGCALMFQSARGMDLKCIPPVMGMVLAPKSIKVVLQGVKAKPLYLLYQVGCQEWAGQPELSNLLTKWAKFSGHKNGPWFSGSVAQSSLTLCYPMDCSPPVSSVHGILQARILEWVATPGDPLCQGIFLTQRSNPVSYTQVNLLSEPLGKPLSMQSNCI